MCAAQLIGSGTHVQDLIQDFSKPEPEPHAAITVDMLDTGIDVPSVVNLVLVKAVQSKTKFWQMLGRGTRLCEDRPACVRTGRRSPAPPEVRQRGPLRQPDPPAQRTG